MMIASHFLSILHHHTHIINSLSVNLQEVQVPAGERKKGEFLRKKLNYMKIKEALKKQFLLN